MNWLDSLRLFYSDKHVLVTGAGGNLGCQLARTLAPLAASVRALVREEKQSPALTEVGVRALPGDIRRDSTWHRAFKERVDIVFHLAAREYRRGVKSSAMEDVETNTVAVLRLLEAATAQKNIPRILLASSSTVIGAPERVPVNESAPEKPLNMYSIHKLTAEKYLTLYSMDYGVPCASLRLSNVYGPTVDRALGTKLALNRLVRDGLEYNKISLFGNRAHLRDYLFVEDAILAFLFAGASEGALTGANYQVGSGVGTTIEAAATMASDVIFRKTGRRPELVHDDGAELAAIERRHFVADTTAFRAATQWSPSVDLVRGMELTVEFFMGNKEMKRVA